ncbi:MAG: methylated-DNA--[protein]-cysteine S-methyltransferase [Dehalococcoidales bacterium]|nr:methylated-DNA--[protein]-cysteine S-methyltransferase [Dehalococcoidales bacterium]MDD4794048.1 methylated-DNA--[protein]-cysteine S-methyltransferase [Dehalococcoidales bacterium]MDD5122241.1 methylated-DNA--[protein]-cysteine S-methyltransferase [Dehalococcoidales bacterium]MDD5498206.1 methylated-DNA--[protein]-cysteine S-methyltransferase [Dehalococcoidales bacterium]
MITASLTPIHNNCLPLAYSAFYTSRGWIGILASSRGIRKLILPRESRLLALSMLGDLSNAMHDTDCFKQLEQTLHAYFNGEIVIFDQKIDLEGYTAFMQKVWEVTREIGYGKTASYQEIAAKAGSPRAFRATGQALKRNPVPIIIPCHRIIASSGQVGGFNGGIALKQDLLQMEQAGLLKVKPTSSRARHI